MLIDTRPMVMVDSQPMGSLSIHDPISQKSQMPWGLQGGAMPWVLLDLTDT